MLRWRHLRCLKKIERYPLVLQQIEKQYKDLQSVRIKRYDILEAFHGCLQNSPSSAASLDDWVKKSTSQISASHDLFVADGVKWGGKLSNNLNYSVTEICKHSILTLLLLETLTDDDYPGDMNRSTSCSMNDFCHSLTVDIDAFTKEKFGVCPQIVIDGELLLEEIRPSLIHFSVVELLKNSIYAVIKRFGVLDLDDAGVIEIRLDPLARRLTLTDPGVGMNEIELKNCFEAFYTTTPLNTNPTYQYSRDFGVPYSGAGFGMLKSRVCLSYLFLPLTVSPVVSRVPRRNNRCQEPT
jgi:hypothetical protein